MRTNVLPLGLLAAATLLVAAPAASASATAGSATYANYAAPSGMGDDAAEPSIGFDPKRGKVMYQAGLQTLRVDLSSSPPAWTDVSSTLTSITSLDPILFTDQGTGRTFVSQLAADCSLMAFSDDAGASWTPNPLGCGIVSGFDHQSVGGGPFSKGSPLGPVDPSYPDAVYYCSQAVVSAQCHLSQDGGLTFNPGVPVYNATQCGGLHGHVKVAPDGTVYLPNADCGGRQGFGVSKDNGTTWTLKTMPGSTTQDESDPSVGIDSAGSAYLGYDDSEGPNGSESHPMASVYSPSQGTWSAPTDVGAPFGIRNAQFPAVVGGSAGRAAFAFLGTPTAGDDQSSSFNGVWHLYVATTTDGGSTWSTVDATPSDPVQRGCIWLGGGSNQCRNLLDFMDATIDATGHVLVGYADGCTGTCANGGTNTYSAKATIAAQTSGALLR